MRKALMRKQVQLQEELRAALCNLAEVMFQLRPAEDTSDLLRQVCKGLALLLAQIKPCQLVIPALVLKLLRGLVVNLFLLRTQIVLLQKARQPLIEQRIIGIPIQLSPQNSKSLWQLPRRSKASKI